MASRLRFGVIGLGRRWPRYRQALAALASDLRVTAVLDGSLDRAEREARSLGCEIAPGIVELLERKDVDALLLPSAGWHGLWPLEQALRLGKPVLCAASPTEDEVHVEALRQRLPAEPRIHVALWPALGVAMEVLAEQLEESLGRIQLIRATWTHKGDRPRSGAGFSSSSVLAILRGCADLFGTPPVAVRASGASDQPGFASVVLEFGAGRLAQLSTWDGPAANSSCRIQVEAEHGSAQVELPRQVAWQDTAGRHTRELPAGLAEMFVVDRFVQAVGSNSAPRCDLARACEALDWLRQARAGLTGEK